jgi:hypothetical protein
MGHLAALAGMLTTQTDCFFRGGLTAMLDRFVDLI